jgi:acyl-homoserine-lactone acylase
VLSNRQYGAELSRDAFVSLCRSFPGGLAPRSSGPPVGVGNACEVLARWDLRENLDSRGAILFRRIFAHALDAAALWATPFDRLDPVRTPNTLNTADPTVRAALGDAIADLRGAKIPVDARVRDVQRVVRRRRSIPVHGGPGDPFGQFNAIYAPFAPGRGFGPVDSGSSFIQVVTWHAGPCPDAATILTYGESSNPRSRHSADQTRLFSRKKWVSGRFCRRDVFAHTRSKTVLTP